MAPPQLGQNIDFLHRKYILRKQTAIKMEGTVVVLFKKQNKTTSIQTHP